MSKHNRRYNLMINTGGYKVFCHFRRCRTLNVLNLWTICALDILALDILALDVFTRLTFCVFHVLTWDIMTMDVLTGDIMTKDVLTGDVLYTLHFYGIPLI